MRILFWIIALPIIAIAMAFAVSNHEMVTISLWPLGFRLESPLYIVVTGALFLGLVCGLLYGWIHGMGVRHRARVETKLVAKLQSENDDLRRKLALAENARHALPVAGTPDYPAQATLRHLSGSDPA